MNNAQNFFEMSSFLSKHGVDVAAILSQHSKCDCCDQRNETVMYHHDIYEDYMACKECYEGKLEMIEDMGYNPYETSEDEY